MGFEYSRLVISEIILSRRQVSKDFKNGGPIRLTFLVFEHVKEYVALVAFLFDFIFSAWTPWLTSRSFSRPLLFRKAFLFWIDIAK